MTAQNKTLSTIIKISIILISIHCNCLLADVNPFHVEEKHVISASYVKASVAALQNFEIVIKNNYSKGGDVATFLSDIKNYDVSFSENKSSYKIIIFPKKFKEQYIKGGGAMYEIHKINFSIVKRQLLE